MFHTKTQPDGALLFERLLSTVNTDASGGFSDDEDNPYKYRFNNVDEAMALLRSLPTSERESIQIDSKPHRFSCVILEPEYSEDGSEPWETFFSVFFEKDVYRELAAPFFESFEKMLQQTIN